MKKKKPFTTPSDSILKKANLRFEGNSYSEEWKKKPKDAVSIAKPAYL